MKEKLDNAMIALQNGDTNALAIIYELTYRGVFTFVLPIVKDYAIAEDILEQTYISVFENAQSYTKGSNVKNWILTIAKNIALNEVNKNKRITSFDYDAEQLTPDGLYSLDDSLDTPIIKLANEILDDDELKIVIMYTIGGYKHREIAEIMNLPIGTVTWKYKNALEKLKTEIEKRDKYAEEKLRKAA